MVLVISLSEKLQQQKYKWVLYKNLKSNSQIVMTKQNVHWVAMFETRRYQYEDEKTSVI